MKINTLYLLLAGLALVACDKDPVTPSLGDVDPTTYISIGTNAASGYADDALHNDAQVNSYANILHGQMNVNADLTFIQPLVNEGTNGINLNGDAHLILGYKTDCKDTVSLSPIRIADNGNTSAWNDAFNSIDNFGVPSLKILDLDNVGFGNSASGAGNYDPYFARMASDQATSSVLSDAIARDPSFFSVMLGDADIMNFATTGGAFDPITPSAGVNGVGFEGTLDAALTALTANGANGVIATIPDVLDYPYFNTIPYDGLALDADKTETMNSVFNPIGLYFTEGDNPFTMECDCNLPYGVRKMEPGELVTLSIPLDSVKCNGMGSIQPIPDRYVLTLAEIAEIQAKINEYNTIIRAQALKHDLALADLNQLYKGLNTGVLYNGINLSAEFVTGGAYSLDGRNLNPIGQALIANTFIEAINEKFNANIPFADVTKYHGVLFP
jgi:hypothetical protein